MPNDPLRTAYDAWHRNHATGNGPWYDLARKSLIQRDLLAGADVLEVACGSGAFAAWMAIEGAKHVHACDFSHEAIAAASKHFSFSNLTFAVADVEHLAFERESFDVVVSCETLEHLRHPRRAVSELARVLRPRGVLLVTTPNYMSITGFHRAYRELTGRKWDEGGQPIARWTTLPRTALWLAQSGFALTGLTGCGWYVPVPGRPGDYAWGPQHGARAF